MTRILSEILVQHKLWLNHNGGQKADLFQSQLRGVDLSGAILRWADLRETDLRNADLTGADLRETDLRNADLRNADLTGADLTGANIDFSCLPLYCGSKFKADNRICKQLVAHVVKILELSGEGSPELLTEMNKYKSGWHRESEFDKE